MTNNISASEWRRRIEAWKRSGQTAGDYGARHGIKARQLYWWSWWLRRKGGPEGKAAVSAEQQSVRLLPVRVVDAGTPRATTESATVRCAEVSLQGGRVLRIAEGVDPDWAARLVVRIAQESGSC